MLIRDIVIIVGTYSNFKAFGDCNVWLKILKLGQNYKMVVDPRQIQKNKLRNGKKGSCMAIYNCYTFTYHGYDPKGAKNFRFCSLFMMLIAKQWKDA